MPVETVGEVVARSSLRARLRRKVVRLHDRLNATGTINWDERKVRTEARSLDDLCALTERWLRGDLKSQPGYYGSVDVDEGDDEGEVPGLAEGLVACLRAGFLTRNSQAGFDGTGFDGNRWVQVAAVDGYASEETVARLCERLAGTPYVVEAFRRPRRSRGSVVPVTWVEGSAYTHFGGGRRAGDVRFELEGAGAAAVEDAVDARQVVVYDPEPGRNTLWADLRQALGGS